MRRRDRGGFDSFDRHFDNFDSHFNRVSRSVDRIHRWAIPLAVLGCASKVVIVLAFLFVLYMLGMAALGVTP